MRDAARHLAIAVAVLAGCWAGNASATLRQTEKGVFVEDFEDGLLLDWKVSVGTHAEIEQGGGGPALDMDEAGNRVLNVRGAGRLTLAGRKFRDFAAELTLTGGEGGISFGGKYQAILTPYFGGSLRITEKGKGDLALLKRGYKIGRSYRLKVVCFGPVVRVHVNGLKEFEKTDAAPVEGSIALVTGKKGALLDDVRISTRLSPADGTSAVPKDDDRALVFSAAADAILHLETTNCSASKVRLVVAVRHFDATLVREEKDAARPKGCTIVKFGTKDYFSIETVPDKTVSRSETIVKPMRARALRFNLGKVPPGFYMVDISFFSGGKEQSHAKYPFAVFEDTKPVEYEPPVIPMGVYTAKMPKAMKQENPIWWHTYVHAIALALKQRNLNTVVACGSYEPDTIGIFQKYGISVLQRGARCLDHPGVIGTLVGDEPHPPEIDYYRAQYEEMRKKTNKPIVTCCVGDGIGLGGKHFFWREINPRIRLFRWYGVKKHFYGIRHHPIYKGILPFSDVLRIADSSFDTPYWVVLPALGGTQHEAYFQYPSPAQHRGMMHLAVAHGAKGILLYSLQAAFRLGLVDSVTLRPNGKNLDAIGEAAGRIERHAGLIRSLAVGKLDVRCASPDIEPVPLHDGKDGRYVYVINRNTRESVSCRLSWPLKLKRTKVKDLFTGTSVLTDADECCLNAPLELAPGEGRLLAVSKEE